MALYLCYSINKYIYVTQHEKTGLMYTKYTYSCYSKYLPYCIRFSKSVTCMRFLINSCINGKNCVRFLCLHKKLFNFEIQKCGQILCAHKTHFLMPGHIYPSDLQLNYNQNTYNKPYNTMKTIVKMVNISFAEYSVIHTCNSSILYT